MIARNFHAIEGPNGMCACGVKADGTVVTCAALLEEYIQERIQALMASASPQAKGEDWQPIDTAPERRKVAVTWVNALGKRRTTYASFWPIGTLDMGDGVSEDEVDEDGKNTYAGWFEESEANDEEMWRLIVPLTHWQHMPLPPSARPASLEEPQQP